jgi:hypothetical protein
MFSTSRVPRHAQFPKKSLMGKSIQVGDAHPNKTAAESAMKMAADCK